MHDTPGNDAVSPKASNPHRMTRRSAAKLLGGALLSSLSSSSLLRALPAAQPRRLSHGFSQRMTDNAFLDDMQRSACLYFTEQVEPSNGQVLDRAFNKNTTGARDSRFVSSVAATGFGLTALCIADSKALHLNQPGSKTGSRHPQISPQLDAARTRLLLSLQRRRNRQASHQQRSISSIDTSIFLCGALTCRAHFNDPEITHLATQLYNRVDWPWMLNGGKTFSKGWRPETGFVYSRWDHYCELMMLYLLAIGSPTHPISPDHWNNFTRPTSRRSAHTPTSADTILSSSISTLTPGSTSHTSRDAYADYFANSIIATRAHKAFCLSLNRGYTEDFWGVTASDWQHGYTAWGGPPLLGPVDGSVVPAATAGSLPFLPAECLRVLRSLRDNYGDEAWGRYGLCDAFHPALSWYDPDVLGIDLGIGLLQAENLRTGFVWGTFMKNPEPFAALKMTGFENI